MNIWSDYIISSEVTFSLLLVGRNREWVLPAHASSWVVLRSPYSVVSGSVLRLRAHHIILICILSKSSQAHSKVPISGLCPAIYHVCEFHLTHLDRMTGYFNAHSRPSTMYLNKIINKINNFIMDKNEAFT